MKSDNISLRWSSLVLLGFQNFAYGILLPISRHPNKDGNVFFGPTAVVTTEFLKILIALCALLYEARRERREALPYQSLPMDEVKASFEEEVKSAEQSNFPNSIVEENDSVVLEGQPSLAANLKVVFLNKANLMLILPAFLFVVQNNLQIISANYLDATEFQVLSQLKIVTAAVCSVLILKKRLRLQHWISIVILLLGIYIVQLDRKEIVGPVMDNSHHQAFVLGLVSMLGACCFSGIASITMEYLLKNETGFWISNLLLASYSIIPALFPVIADCTTREEFRPYRYFTYITWLTIFLNAIGGILVAMVMKYADNILKGFSVSGALIVTVFVHGYASHSGVPWLRLLGSLIVVSSMYGYGQAGKMKPKMEEVSIEEVDPEMGLQPH